MRSATCSTLPPARMRSARRSATPARSNLLGDPLDDRVAGQVARGRFDQRPAHRLPDGVLGERALQHAVDRPLRVAGGDHDIDDGQRGAAGEVAGGRPCAALQTLSGPDALRHRPERHANRIRRQRHVSAFLASPPAFLELRPAACPSVTAPGR